MNRIIKKFNKDQSGFTLTEILIGMSVLTVAIVAATSLLVSLINSNRNSVTVMQAYYLAQEGIESVRNIRDTNWLYNRDWLEVGVVWGGSVSKFEVGNDYVIDVKPMAWNNPSGGFVDEKLNGEVLRGALANVSPWSVESTTVGEVQKIFLVDDGNNFYFTSAEVAGAKETDFSRKISLLPYECDEEDCRDYVLVRSEVFWDDGSFYLDGVLTDWKGGVL